MGLNVNISRNKERAKHKQNINHWHYYDYKKNESQVVHPASICNKSVLEYYTFNRLIPSNI